MGAQGPGGQTADSRRLLETSNQVNEATRILSQEAETFFRDLAAA